MSRCSGGKVIHNTYARLSHTERTAICRIKGGAGSQAAKLADSC